MSDTVILSVVNHKGGVGKTTTVVNLAHALIRLGKTSKENYTVLVIDSDPQSNATMTLFPSSHNYDKAPTLADVYGEHRLHIRQVVVKTDIDNLYLAPSSIDLFDVEPVLTSSGLGVEALRIALSDGTLLSPADDGPRFDFIIIDTPPNLGIFMLNSLLVSHYYLIPVECGSYYSLQGMNTLERRVSDIKMLCKDLRLLGCLPTMLDTRTAVGNATLAALRDHYREEIMETVIRRNTDLEKAASNDQTIFEFDATVNGAKDYYLLAKEVVQKCLVGREARSVEPVVEAVA